MQNMKMVNCGACKHSIVFDLNVIRKPLHNKIKCNNCGKEWATTISASCCYINIKFVAVEKLSKKPMVFIKTFTK